MNLVQEEVSASLSDPIIRLGKDIRKASSNLSCHEVRWLVDTYYQMQDGRIRSKNQLDRQQESSEPNNLINWVFKSWKTFESSIKSSLGEFAATYSAGKWLQAQYGIGPVLSSAMLAYFDIRKAPTVGHFWRFSGMDPTCKWEKGQKRPWNAMLKSVIVFRMGECFVKFQNRDNCFYGKLLASKKLELTTMNDSGKFSETAKNEIARCEANKALLKKMQTTGRWKHWQEGRLCPQHVHDRARRWAVKLFLSHLHEIMYWDYFGKSPPAPYVFDHPELGDHRHLLVPQLWAPGGYTILYPGKSLKQLYGEK